jgi:LysR family transcriptional regulator, glycine cleavage system transcriptional activator
MPGRTRTRRGPAHNTAIARRLPLGSLRVFVMVAECRSFTLAADALGVSVSAASMQVRSLEEYLGLSLFRRAGRIVEPTAEAAQLLPRIRDGLAALQFAIDDARAARGAGMLHVSALASFVAQWLSPRLHDFERRHPSIQLRIEASHVAVDFAATGIHAAIRFGAGGWPGVHAEKLLDEWLVPVCRPELLEKLGPVESHADLSRYRLLHSTTEPWTIWLSGLVEERWPDSGLGFDDSATIVRLAAAGAGLALARWSLIAEEVRTGELAIASRRITPFGRRYYFVCSPKARGLKKLEAFRAWLLAQAALFAAPPSAAGRSHPRSARRRRAEPVAPDTCPWQRIQFEPSQVS